jgi:uncharacterized membrane protein (GlpM family)
MQWVIRFLVGGAVVCIFSLAGDVLRPKGFAGLFSAAPSVALATLALTVYRQGTSYAALEARSMMLGSVGLFVYAIACVYLMAKRHMKAGAAGALMLLLWAAVAFTLRFGLLE